MAEEMTFKEWAKMREGCMEPNALWGVCGIPKDVHDEAFKDLKGGRFYHDYRAAAVNPASSTRHEEE